MNVYVFYCGVVKGKIVVDFEVLFEIEFQIVYENWEKVYKLVFVVDGQCFFYFFDGIDLFKVKYKKIMDVEEKKVIVECILNFYDQQIECYKNEVFLFGCKGFDMFYMLEYGFC